MNIIGKVAPSFSAQCVFENEIKSINIEDYKGKYIILFFYPLDFTFVCPTELLALEGFRESFEKRNAVILACSVDSEYCHLAWLSTDKVNGGIAGVKYGIISDLGGKIAEKYGVLSDGGVAFRGVFMIDREQVIRACTIKDFGIGRSVDEISRTLDALQHCDQFGEVCPVNWKSGEKGMAPDKESLIDYLTNLDV